MIYIKFLLDPLPRGIITSGNDCQIQLQLFDNRHRMKADGKTPKCASFGGYLYFNGTNDGGSYQFISGYKYSENVEKYALGFRIVGNQQWLVRVWNWAFDWIELIEAEDYEVRVANCRARTRYKGRPILPEKIGFLILKNDTPVACRIIDGTADCVFSEFNERENWMPDTRKNGKLQARWWKTIGEGADGDNECEDYD